MKKILNLMTRLALGTALVSTASFAAEGNGDIFKLEKSVKFVNQKNHFLLSLFETEDNVKLIESIRTVAELPLNLEYGFIKTQFNALKEQQQETTLEKQAGQYFSLSGSITGQASQALKARAINCCLEALEKNQVTSSSFLIDFGKTLKNYINHLPTEEAKTAMRLSIDLYDLAQKQNPENKDYYDKAVDFYKDQFRGEYDPSRNDFSTTDSGDEDREGKEKGAYLSSLQESSKGNHKSSKELSLIEKKLKNKSKENLHREYSDVLRKRKPIESNPQEELDTGNAEKKVKTELNSSKDENTNSTTKSNSMNEESTSAKS